MSNIKSLIIKNLNFTAKSIGTMFAFTTAVNFINFIYHVIMGRLLGPEQYGILASIISFIFIAMAISGTIQTSATKFTSIYFAEDDTQKIRSFFLIITKRVLLFTSCIFIIILIFLSRLTTFLNLNSVLPLIFLGIMIVEGSMIAIGRGALQGIKKFKDLGINLVVEVILKISLGVALVYLGLKANGAIIGFMLAALFSYLLVFIPLNKILKKNTDNMTEAEINLKVFYKDIIFIAISTTFFSLFCYTDIILVKHFFTPYEAGYYSAAVQVGRIILFFTGAIGAVMLPRFAEKHVKKENLFSSLIKSSLVILVISVIFLIFYILFPEFIIKLIYGAEYLMAAKLIFRYGIFMMLVSLIYMQIYYFISTGKFWYLIYMILILGEQFVLIWIYGSSLNIIILILVANASVLFLLNILTILILNKIEGKE